LIGTVREYINAYDGSWRGYRRQFDVYSRILSEYLHRYKCEKHGVDGVEYNFPDIIYDIRGERV